MESEKNVEVNFFTGGQLHLIREWKTDKHGTGFSNTDNKSVRYVCVPHWISQNLDCVCLFKTSVKYMSIFILVEKVTKWEINRFGDIVWVFL